MAPAGSASVGRVRQWIQAGLKRAKAWGLLTYRRTDKRTLRSLVEVPPVRSDQKLDAARHFIFRSPDFLSISAGPHGWKQVLTVLPTVSGLCLDLPDQVTSGTLSYEVFLRGFADGARDIVELKNIGSIGSTSADRR
jgi:hypothetical protein